MIFVILRSFWGKYTNRVRRFSTFFYAAQKLQKPSRIVRHRDHQTLHAHLNLGRHIKETRKRRATPAAFIISNLLDGNAEQFGELLLGKIHVESMLVDERAKALVTRVLFHRCRV